MKNKMYAITLVAIMALAIGVPTVQAATWQGDSSTNWHFAGNWNTGAVPGAGDIAAFNATFTGNDQPEVRDTKIGYIGKINFLTTATRNLVLTVNGTLYLDENAGLTVNQANTTKYMSFSGAGLLVQTAVNGEAVWYAKNALYVNTATFQNSCANLIMNANTGALIRVRSDYTGTGNITKIGEGKLLFDSTVANTNTGNITVEVGQLQLNQTTVVDGTFVGGTIFVNQTGATLADVLFSQNDQIANTSGINITKGQVDMNTKTDTIASLILNGTDALVIGGTGELTVLADVDARAGTITTVLAGDAGLDKTTDGTVVLGGTNTYTGTTTVSAGELDITGSVAGNVTVDGGLLSYNSTTELTNITFTSGSIGGEGDVDFGGLALGSSHTLAPGNSIGSQTLSGISGLNGAAYELEFGLGLAQNNDKLTIEGDVALTALTIDLYTMLDTDTRGNMDGFDQSQNYVWEDVLTITGTVTGTVDNITLDTTNVTDSYSGTFSIADSGGGAYDLEYNIPEPATMSLLALGGIAMLKRRKK
jgi:fibronectin-binding autotransporter adhesin